MRFPTSLLIFAAASLTFVACRKNKDEDTPDLDYTSASDNTRADDIFSDIMGQVDKAVTDNGLRDACDPTVTFDTLSTPRTLTLDFGDVNCTSSNGRLRRGKILVSFTGRYRDEGTVITIIPENYYVNNYLVLGTKTVTNLGLDANDHIHFAIAVNGSITAPDGSWIATHTAARTRTWIEGSNTPELSDDVYLITGGGSGVNRNGLPYTVAITQALRVELDCAFITQGTVQITPATGIVRTIDYGNGSCDGTFTVTVNGHTFTVTIG
ncbi:MAG: hypothetical protein IPI81_16560 [Flavobacteriales bacterium]|nr:hypothetical protein [Flavobacteriales bacterium]MCC6938303.1 hypothetical protein [Flavobacteriales bacterium]